MRIVVLALTLIMPLAAQDAAARVEQSSQLAALMKEHKIPSVSVAVIKSGKIAWTKVWGPGDAETVFQAASISKPIAATAALHMAQYGNFTLDEDVNTKLKSWKIPPLSFENQVTVRRLLTHSAGLTVHGFPGYAAGAPLPTLVQVLDGAPPANTAAIEVDIEPGTKWRYSGGGYTVLQQLMIDRMNWTFPEIMQRMVLQPIRMQRSNYEQPLAASLAGNAAAAHHRDGMPYDGKWHAYPELAAAGLWTTPSDLAAWAIEIWNAYHGRSNRVIERSTAREMLERQFANHGLGPAMQGQGATLRFGHGGSNAGFNCVLTMYVEQGDGAAIMTNSDNGSRVFGPLLKAIAVEQRWPPD